MSLLKSTSLMSRSQPSLDLIAGPPPEVLDEVAAAWERAQEALPEDLVLDFGSEPALRRAWGELRPAGGRVERISALDAVAIACGDAALVRVPTVAV